MVILAVVKRYKTRRGSPVDNRPFTDKLHLFVKFGSCIFFICIYILFYNKKFGIPVLHHSIGGSGWDLISGGKRLGELLGL